MSPTHTSEGDRGKMHKRLGTNAAEQAEVNVPGPVYAFVPAHGGSRAGAVQEHLARTWSEGFGLSVLLVDFAQGKYHDVFPVIHRDGLLDRCTVSCGSDGRTMKSLAGSRYDVICVDLTGAHEHAATTILTLAHSVFVVTDSAEASLDMAQETVGRLKLLKLGDRVALLLRRTDGGLRPDLAEDVAGAPVCGLVETPEQLTRLARWLAQPQPAVDQAATA